MKKDPPGTKTIPSVDPDPSGRAGALAGSSIALSSSLTVFVSPSRTTTSRSIVR